MLVCGCCWSSYLIYGGSGTESLCLCVDAAGHHISSMEAVEQNLYACVWMLLAIISHLWRQWNRISMPVCGCCWSSYLIYGGSGTESLCLCVDAAGHHISSMEAVEQNLYACVWMLLVIISHLWRQWNRISMLVCGCCWSSYLIYGGSGTESLCLCVDAAGHHISSMEAVEQNLYACVWMLLAIISHLWRQWNRISMPVCGCCWPSYLIYGGSGTESLCLCVDAAGHHISSMEAVEQNLYACVWMLLVIISHLWRQWNRISMPVCGCCWSSYLIYGGSGTESLCLCVDAAGHHISSMEAVEQNLYACVWMLLVIISHLWRQWNRISMPVCGCCWSSYLIYGGSGTESLCLCVDAAGHHISSMEAVEQNLYACVWMLLAIISHLWRQWNRISMLVCGCCWSSYLIYGGSGTESVRLCVDAAGHHISSMEAVEQNLYACVWMLLVIISHLWRQWNRISMLVCGCCWPSYLIYGGSGTESLCLCVDAAGHHISSMEAVEQNLYACVWMLLVIISHLWRQWNRISMPVCGCCWPSYLIYGGSGTESLCLCVDAAGHHISFLEAVEQNLYACVWMLLAIISHFWRLWNRICMTVCGCCWPSYLISGGSGTESLCLCVDAAGHHISSAGTFIKLQNTPHQHTVSD